MQTQHLPPAATPLAVLEAAQRLIADKTRWTQNALARKKASEDPAPDGRPHPLSYPAPCLPNDRGAEQWCAIGAVLAVTGASARRLAPAQAHLAMRALAAATKKIDSLRHADAGVAEIVAYANDNLAHEDVLKIFHTAIRDEAVRKSPHSALELLLRAQELIAQPGAYSQIALANDAGGKVVAPGDPTAVAWDALGALVYVSGKPIGEFTTGPSRKTAQHIRAMEALRIAMGGGRASFAKFAEHHKHADVMIAFDNAIAALSSN